MSDLPNFDERPQRGPDEMERHWWRLFTALLYFSVLYSSLHKIFVPIGLKQLGLPDPRFAAYTQVDYWFLPGLVLAIVVWRKGALGLWGSLFAGVCVAYAVFEAFMVAQGHYPGWLALSHVLASIPNGAISVALLTRRKRLPKQSWAWIGAIVVGALLLTVDWMKPADLRMARELAPSIEERESLPALENPSGCGQAEFSFDPKQIPLTGEKASKILLLDCGFQPTLLREDKGLFFQNSLDRSANFHWYEFSPSGAKKSQNRVLRAGERIEVTWSEESFRLMILFSDALPKAGLSVVVRSVNDSWGLIEAQRIPPRIFLEDGKELR